MIAIFLSLCNKRCSLRRLMPRRRMMLSAARKLVSVSTLFLLSNVAAMHWSVVYAGDWSGERSVEWSGNWFSHEFEVMGTRAHIELWAADQPTAESAMALVEAEMHRIDKTMSAYRADNLLAKINSLAVNEAIVVSDELFALLEASLRFSRASKGAFDISYESVGYLYDFRQSLAPNNSAVDRLLQSIDYRSIRLDPKGKTIAFAKPNMRINLGGIAKGYAVDRSIKLLRDAGIESAIVSAGGDSRMLSDRGPLIPETDKSEDSGQSEHPLSGDKSGDKSEDSEIEAAQNQRVPWLIGIQHPRDKTKHALRIPLSDTALSTSGDYERFFISAENATRMHHIIDPKTGRSSTGLVSVTVIGPQSLYCDALSTTLFVLGKQDALTLIDSFEGYEAILIDAQGQLSYSSGLVSEDQR